MERGKRIELSALAWKAKVLPLYEPRLRVTYYLSYYTPYVRVNLVAGPGFEPGMLLAYETGVVAALPAIIRLHTTFPIIRHV